jgi:anti-sigma factor ChrR (cupin superfamily)
MTEAKCVFIEEYLPDLLLGELPSEAADAVQQHLKGGCRECRMALGEDAAAVSSIALTASAPAPGNLKARLMERVRNRHTSAFVEPQPGLLVAFSAQMPWEETGLAGVRRKLLHLDSGTGTITAIVHMDAGIRYPAHRHAGMESLFMLSGTLDVSGIRVRAGDLCLAHAHTVHGEVHAIEASDFLVIANEADELLLTT